VLSDGDGASLSDIAFNFDLAFTFAEGFGLRMTNLGLKKISH
jgi:hypothetical protein